MSKSNKTTVVQSDSFLLQNTGQEWVAILKGLISERSDDFKPVAENYYDKAKEEGDKVLMSEIRLQQCVYDNHISSRYEDSNSYAFECLDLARETGNASMEANALRMIGVNFNFLGELSKAREAYDEGVRILELRDNLTDGDKAILAGLYFNIVTLYRDSDLDEGRLQYIDKAYNLFSETGNRQGVARCYISYANNYPGIKGTHAAIEYQQKAQHIFKEIGDNRGRGNCLVNMGFLLCDIEAKYEEGMAMLQEGIELLSKSGSSFYVINGYFNMVCALRIQGRYDEAVTYLKKIEEATNNSQSRMNKANLYEEWANVLEMKGDFKEALSYYKKYKSEKAKTYQFDKSSAVSDVRMSFELEERKKEAQALKKKNLEVEAYARKLEISNFELKQFAHVASHDLKEPLRMVSLYMQLLEKHAAGKLDKEEIEYLYFAREGANRMYNLIESLLALSNINPEVHKEEVDLNKVYQETIEFLQPEIDRKQMKINCTALPKVKANKTQMLQLFENLIANAIKYNNSAKPVLDISSLRSDSSFYFSFCDNGIGIKEKYRQKVFEVFQRLHSRNEYSGTGIGLTVCKKIVEHLQGRIWIEDGKDGGSCFKFTIPV
ncbi:MAG: ATP-binding protein [Chitinophagales bacterium]